MPSLAETIASLSSVRRMAAGQGRTGAEKLSELGAFGSNPGALRAKFYRPQRVTARPALVIVLHGCTQTAEAYDRGSGWSQLADRHGFVLLYPEQQRQNNPNLCFNWFSPEDSRRGGGEALSIRQMMDPMVADHDIDPARIFVTGLSAGGAMASVMLATYPERFAGGAIIAGLPYGCANTMPQAFDRMRGNGGPSEGELVALVRNASDHAGPWPTISVWHGSADATVNPANADAIVGQWRLLHGLDATPSRTDAVEGYPRRVWRDAHGRDVIEDYSITGMGHGTPLDPSGAGGCGQSGAFMLDARISSSEHICRFWGLRGGEQADAADGTIRRKPILPSPPVAPEAGRIRQTRPPLDAPVRAGGVGRMIEDALRAAGLMR